MLPLTLDVTDAEQIAQAAERVGQLSNGSGQSSHGGLDALVNNAGIGVGGPLELIPPGGPAQAVRGQRARSGRRHPGDAARAAPGARADRVPLLRRRARGDGLHRPYAASKHAIEAIGDALRVELRSSNVQVALVEPGSVATPIWDKGRAEAERMSIPPELQDQYGHVPAAMDKVLARHRPARRRARAGRADDRARAHRAADEGALRGRARRQAMVLARRLLPDHVFDRVARRALGV